LLGGNAPTFFPEYTEHGIEHVRAVWLTALALIPDRSVGCLTPADIGILVLATLLPDLGMYLTEDGFFQLIGAGDRLAADPGLRSGLDPNSWPDLWDDFLEEAARFDDNALVRLFGDAEPARRPPLDKQLLTRRDRVLIGEFIRRHHPRLAHKIAVLGVPGVGSNLSAAGVDVTGKSNVLADDSANHLLRLAHDGAQTQRHRAGDGGHQ